MAEYQRKGSFVRLYPSKGSHVYDVYFNGSRPLNKFLYKVLYGDEFLPSKGREAPKLNYKLDMPQNYDYYKKKTQEATKVKEPEKTIELPKAEIGQSQSEKQLEFNQRHRAISSAHPKNRGIRNPSVPQITN